jgi:hypothetical protein
MLPETYWKLRSLSLEYDLLDIRYKIDLDTKRTTFLKALELEGITGTGRIIFNDQDQSIEIEPPPVPHVIAEAVSFEPPEASTSDDVLFFPPVNNK